MSDATFQVAITASDKTKAGVLSALKNVKGVLKAEESQSARAVSGINRSIGSSGRGIVNTFRSIESASSRAIGGGGGALGRLSALASMGETAAGGLGEAAVAGGLLEVTLGAVSAGAAIVAGVLVGVAAATDKVVGSWAKGVAGAAQLADTIGIATKALQEFQGAGERVGIDPNSSAAGLAGLANTLNDAQHGKNQTASATLAALGIAMKLNDDGTVDVAAMLPAIAKAAQGRSAYGAHIMAQNLGYGDAVSPLFRQGPEALAADMADVEKHGVVNTPGEIAAARRWRRKRVMLGQTFNRASNAAGAWGADQTQGTLDKLTDVAQQTIDTGGQNLAKGALDFAKTVTDEFKPAVDTLAAAVGNMVGGRMNGSQISGRAAHARAQYQKYLGMGMSPDEAAAWAANAEAESASDHRKRQPGGPGRGLYQWGANKPKFDRRLTFQRVIGKPIEQSTEAEQDRFRAWELGHTEGRAKLLIDRAQGAGAKAAAITRYYERPKNGDRDAADRANIAEEILRQNGGSGGAPTVHHHSHNITIARDHARVTTATDGAKPTISYARFADE